MSELFSKIFDSLSDKQIEALSNVAFGGRGFGCHPRILKSLEKLDLIIPQPKVSGTPMGKLEWTEYGMAIPVHIAFCQWCSKYYGDDNDV